MAYAGEAGEIFVANQGSDTVSVISDANNTVVATISVGVNPDALAYDSELREVLVANSGSNNVSVISDANNTVVATISVGVDPDALAYASGVGETFVMNSGSNNVSVISDETNTVVATISVGVDPDALTYDSGVEEVFVANFGSLSQLTPSDNVSVISIASNTVVATVWVGSWPIALAYDSGTGEVFVANWGSNSVSVISDVNNNVVATISDPDVPWAFAYDSGTGEIFVANEGGSVWVISEPTDIVVATIPVGSLSNALGYDSEVGEIFVMNWGSNDVSVISDVNNTVVATIPVGTNPCALTYDSGVGEVFVANENSGNVSVIDTPDTVTFTEVGVPVPGVEWTLTFNGTQHAVDTSRVSFRVPVGVYSYTISAPSGYELVSSSPGSPITKRGADVGVAVTFEAADYNVTFTESGVQVPGAEWTLAFNGGPRTLYNTTTVTFSGLTNGTYAFAAAATGYRTITGTVTVKGTPAPVSLQFSPSPVVTTYTVRFAEMGLPSGTSWNLTFNGTLYSSTLNSISILDLINGTYGFTMGTVANYRVSTPSGFVVVSGSSVTRKVTYTTSVNSSSSPTPWAWIVVGVMVVAVIATGMVVYLLKVRKGGGPAVSSVPIADPGSPKGAQPNTTVGTPPARRTN